MLHRVPERARRATALALAALGLLAATPAGAQDVPADTTLPEVRPSEPIPFDTLAFGLAPADTIPVLARRFREGRGPAELAAVPAEDVLLKNPRNAAIRAFLIPGWGQIYTGHPWRALMFAGGEAFFFTMGYRRQQDALAVKDSIHMARDAFFADPPEGSPTDSLALEEQFQRTGEFRTFDARLESIRERRQDWYAWGIASVIFAAVDAYVAAQLDPIDVDMEPDGELRVGLRLPVGATGQRAGPARR